MDLGQLEARWEMKLGFCLIMLFAASNLFGQPVTYKDSLLDCRHTVSDGKIHGAYMSLHPNGAKKSQGSFENNYRIGE
jgi:antitoxin component YwqK of YwqJK toxin-antitoxin module